MSRPASPVTRSNDDGLTPELAVTHPTDTICAITVRCELDMATTPALGRLLTQELDNKHRVVLDLSECDFMDSSGLAVLIAAREHATRTTTHLALAGLTRTVTRALAASGLDPLFDIHPSTHAGFTSLPTG